MKKRDQIDNPECEICGERIGYGKWWQLCPFCRRGWKRGAFWGGLVVGAMIALFQQFDTIMRFFK